MFSPRLCVLWLSAMSVVAVGVNEPVKEATAVRAVATAGERTKNEAQRETSTPRDFFVIRAKVRVEAIRDKDGTVTEGMHIISITPKEPSNDATGGYFVAIGETFTRGILSNVGSVPVRLRATKTDRTYRLAPGETVIIAARKSCSVKCREGYIACCNAFEDWTIDCQCRPDSEQIECQSGGTGAIGCGVTG